MPNTPTETVVRTLATLPLKPGVYIFKDAAGEILYVGKAKNLRARVHSYFQEKSALEERKKSMVSKVATIDATITKTESDALALEATLVKRHQPPYNILLKDDKYFLFIRVTLSDEFPTVELTRGLGSRKDAYFGPYTSSRAVRETLRLLKSTFKFRMCTPHQGKPCFDYGIGRCLGVCVGAVSAKEYQNMIEQLLNVLKGKGQDVLMRLEKNMHAVAQKKQFEYAARLRDRLHALKKLLATQDMVTPTRESFDVLGLACEKGLAVVTLTQVRSGRVIATNNVNMTNKLSLREPEIVKSFIQQWYQHTPEHVKQLFTEILPEDKPLLEKSFHIKILRPQRGKKRTLISHAHENAQFTLTNAQASFEKDEDARAKALQEIAKAFNLHAIPHRMEAFDVANIQGMHAVGSMVVFIDGRPDKTLYKKFSIKTVSGSNDPAMLAEILSRRMARVQNNDNWQAPDLIVLDGGKGQLSVVKKALQNTQRHFPIVALAKGGHQEPTQQSMRERFYTEHGAVISLPVPSAALFMLERLRDEAHRFATGYYSHKHGQETRASVLDDIPGIGPKKRQLLMRHFGSISRITHADAQTLNRLIGQHAASAIRAHLGHAED